MPQHIRQPVKRGHAGSVVEVGHEQDAGAAHQRAQPRTHGHVVHKLDLGLLLLRTRACPASLRTQLPHALRDGASPVIGAAKLQGYRGGGLHRGRRGLGGRTGVLLKVRAHHTRHYTAGRRSVLSRPELGPAVPVPVQGVHGPHRGGAREQVVGAGVRQRPVLQLLGRHQNVRAAQRRDGTGRHHGAYDDMQVGLAAAGVAVHPAARGPHPLLDEGHAGVEQAGDGGRRHRSVVRTCHGQTGHNLDGRPGGGHPGLQPSRHEVQHYVHSGTSAAPAVSFIYYKRVQFFEAGEKKRRRGCIGRGPLHGGV